MKVLLKKDISTLGQNGTLCDVSDGYARNYLIPQGLAVLATPAVMREYERLQARRAVERAELLKKAEELVRRLKGFELTVKAKGEKKSLFGSIGAKEIVAELTKAGYDVAEDAVRVNKPIRTVGEHTVQLNFAPKVKTDITVKVVLEGAVGKGSSAKKATGAKADKNKSAPKKSTKKAKTTKKKAIKKT